MPQIDLQYRLGPCARILLRQQPLQLAIWPVATGDETGRAGGQALRRPHIVDAIAETGFDGCDRDGLVRIGFRFVLRILVEQRNQIEIDIALAERFQWLALEIEPSGGPERVD